MYNLVQIVKFALKTSFLMQLSLELIVKFNFALGWGPWTFVPINQTTEVCYGQPLKRIPGEAYAYKCDANT